VNVEVDAKPQKDLSVAMEEIRTYYEGVAEKNKEELDTWFHTQVGWLNPVKPRVSHLSQSHC